MGAQRVGATIETEQETNQQRCGNMNHIKPHSGGGGAEHTDAHHAQQKAGAGVVAEREQPLGLAATQCALTVQRCRCPHAYGVPAGKAQSQHGSAVSTQPEYGPHQWGKSPIQCCRGKERRQQSRENQKRKQGWHNGFAA